MAAGPPHPGPPRARLGGDHPGLCDPARVIARFAMGDEKSRELHDVALSALVLDRANATGAGRYIEFP